MAIRHLYMPGSWEAPSPHLPSGSVGKQLQRSGKGRKARVDCFKGVYYEA